MKQTQRAKGHTLRDSRQVQLSLRVERELHDRIKASALRNRRTIAQECVYRVMTSLEAEVER